jgi:hypothetical protein
MSNNGIGGARDSWPKPNVIGFIAASRRLWTVFGRCGRKVSQITKSLAYFVRKQ